MKDFRGVQISVGSTVAYPGRNGSSLRMTSGIIIDIDEPIVDAEVNLYNGRVSENRVRVQSSKESYDWRTERREIKTWKAWIHRTDLIAVVESKSTDT